MPITHYGITWWGKEWLNALSGIDNLNRIPRGKTYANTGKVLSVKFDYVSHTIKARVEGNWDPFYSVKIVLPPFTQEEKDKLISAILKTPIVLAKLAAKELAPEIYNIAINANIKIFPESWEDFKMTCSCPDFAVPCKHIAATIFKISEEIDTNPFILFLLRGLDLVEEIKKSGIVVADDNIVDLEQWSQIVKNHLSNDYLEPLDFVQLKEDSYTDFENILDSVVALFQQNPAGYIYGDLRQDLKNVTEKASLLATKQLKDSKDRDIPTYKKSNALIHIDKLGNVNLDKTFKVNMEDDEHELKAKKYTIRNNFLSVKLNKYNKNLFACDLFSGFITAQKLENSPLNLEILYHLWVIATKLTISGSIIPMIYAPLPDLVNVKWIPAIISPHIKKLVARVGQVILSQEKFFEFERYEDQKFDPTFIGTLVLSLFIQDYVLKAYNALEKDKDDYRIVENAILFSSCICDLDEFFSGNSILDRLSSWISPLYIGSHNLSPVILISDEGHSRDDILKIANLYSSDASNVDTDAVKDNDDFVDEEDKFNQTYYYDTSIENDNTSQDLKVDYGDNTSSGLFIELGFANLSEKTPNSYVSYLSILNDDNHKDKKLECLRLASRLSSFCPSLYQLIKEGVDSTNIVMQDLADLIKKSLPALKLLGVKLLVPNSLNKLIKPKSKVALSSKMESSAISFGGLSSIIDFNWEISLGNNKITEEEFNKLRKLAGRVVKTQYGFVFLDPDEIARIQKNIEKNKALSKVEILQAALTGEFNNEEILIDDSLNKILQNMFKAEDVKVPKDFNATLRPYQKRGYSWLVKNARLQIGSILADDMGLGKTIQVIATIEKMREEKALDKKQVLVVVPASLILNWEREITKFAPKLKLWIFYGTNRSLVDDAHVIITTYGTLRSSVKELKKKQWALIVLDEAQAIKNNQTSTTLNVKSLNADSFIAMSGTPVENRLLEYWSIMDFANKGVLGTVANFKKNFATPIESKHDHNAVKRFKKVTSPFILRRLKTDKSIIEDLPSKIVQEEYCELMPKQAAYYENEVEHALYLMKNNQLSQFERSALVLALITKLKQICNSPYQYDNENVSLSSISASGKGRHLQDLVSSLMDSKKKFLIFTQFKAMGDLLVDWLETITGQHLNFIHGGVSVPERMKMVDNFQKDRTVPGMVLSLKAAGTGLNLTEAQAVIHYDLWWNPAVENQATDRAYRIGQKNNVNVYRFITTNTFEEKINMMMKEKEELANLTVSTGEQWIGDLSNRQISEIFSLSKK